MSQYRRLIPVVLIKHGMIIRSEMFHIHQVIGNPIDTTRRLSNWNVDELILIDISESDNHDMRRDDLYVSYKDSSTLGLLEQISTVCSMPLSFGGRIKTLEDARARLEKGADKIIINTQAIETPEFITQCSTEFGAQCVIVNIDIKREDDGTYSVYSHSGKIKTNHDVLAWAKEVECLGAGEIFLQNIDRDGLGNGFDQDIIARVADAVSIPVIACGGAGSYDHFADTLANTNISAIAAANIFNYFELAYPKAKQHCIDSGLSLRPVKLDTKWFPREPVYDVDETKKRINDRMIRAEELKNTPNWNEPKKMEWCTNCTYPKLSATPLAFNEDGLCTGCQNSNVKFEITDSEWERRKESLREIIARGACPNKSRPDCVIGVSGGKDSYFQTHFVKNVLGFEPLLVTYYGNNYTDVGERNLRRMADVFDVNHIIYHPGVPLLKKLNRLGVQIMGDMNWHGHVGISTLPMKMAAIHKIPTVLWGEHGYQDLCGQFSMNDFIEWTYRNRLEHFARGYDWNYMVGLEGITEKNMYPYMYPTDQEIFDVDLRGVFLSNYTPWDANKHLPLMVEKYGFEVSNDPFERTYRLGSNLDDIHENGGHDYLKWIKFGYGRCTDHTSKDVRSQNMTREEAMALIKKHDHIRSKDMDRWSNYTGMNPQEFDAIADTYRDKRVWWKDNGTWKKHNIWDEK
jgi:imidazoleglycerol phosphate synthase cyclase subunit